ncbi:hypothetical protein PIB30_037458 [Stylosanthes scabra]|uniref:Ubiquitin-like protease family profile domain-containing protein n=1 Tax=Stylosanthes scabra TaxID=79078 RepID=A0ABU6TEF1_9FABA|nr:hypothetical protein [Stylosanthes scabra]
MDPPKAKPDRDAAGACVAAALKALNTTLERHTQAQLALVNVTKTQLEVVAEMGNDVRSSVKIVEACLEAFVRPKTPSKEVVTEHVGVAVETLKEVTPTTTPSNNVQVVDLCGGPASENTEPAIGNAEAHPKNSPGPISEWLDDTIMMGPVVDLDDVVASSPGAATMENVSVPPSIRRRLQVRLGDSAGGEETLSALRTKAGSKGKMIEQSPEEAKRSGKLRRSARETTIQLYGYKKVGVVFPSHIRCKFKLLEKHKYSLGEAQMIAYIFADRRNQSEVLFKRDTRKMDREDFATLLLGNEPSDYIMELMAYRTSWTQMQILQKILWSLPIMFSDFVLGGELSLDDLFSFFKDEWLPTPTALKYIYVQMKEVLQPSKESHLYLMVVDIPKTKIWIFDSFTSNESAQGRIDAATSLAKALDHFIRVGFHELDVLGNRPHLHDWGPEIVLGVPNMGNPYKDKLWVLLWLQMDHYFSESAFTTPKSHIDNVGNKVRMDTGLSLVTETFNELKADVTELAKEEWNGRRGGHKINK